MANNPAHPGCTFDVADHVLIDDFLRRKVAGLPMDARSKIHDVDAYSLWPDDLVHNREHAPGTDKHDGKGGDWYFFTPARQHGGGGRRQRAVGGGYTWHAEGGAKPVLDAAGEKRIGYKRKLSYGCYEPQPGGRAPTLTRLGWCMTEFGLDDAGAGLVLCKVYVSTHKTETTYAAVMKATAESKQRMAGGDPHPDAPRPRPHKKTTTHASVMKVTAESKKRKAGGDPHPDAPRPHKKTTTYASVMKATAESKKRKAGDDPHPDAPRPQTPRSQESKKLQEIERLRQEPGGQLEELERWLLSNEDDDTGAVEDDGSVDPAGFFADILEDVEEFCRARAVAPVQHDECTLEELLLDNDMPALETAFKSDCEGCSKSDCEICIQQMLEELT
ncbi:unnamed protein product [Alopecurus aequalis]